MWAQRYEEMLNNEKEKRKKYRSIIVGCMSNGTFVDICMG